MKSKNFCPIEKKETMSSGEFCHKDGARLIESPYKCENDHDCSSYDNYCQKCGSKVAFVDPLLGEDEDHYPTRSNANQVEND
jgi:hypothetical protein